MIPHSRPWITEADIAAVLERLHSEQIAQGELTARLEIALAERYGFAEAIAVGSGCQALLLALKTVGAGVGTRVVLPTYVCPEVLGVVDVIGAEAVISDVDERYQIDWCDPGLKDGRMTAVVVPSLFGWRASGPMAALPGATIVHDWAQYLPERGAYPEVELAILSFGATKVIAAGEGGAILARNPETAGRVRDHKRMAGSHYGVNLYPFSDLQAALALAQLERLDEMIHHRRTQAARYLEVVDELPGVSSLRLAQHDVPFRLPMRLESGRHKNFSNGIDGLIAAFGRHGVAARRPVADLLHHIRATGRTYPLADRLFEETFSLPLYPALGQEEEAQVVRAMREVLIP